MEQRDHLSDEVFFDLQSSMNFSVIRLQQIDLRFIKNANGAFQRDEKLRKSVAQRIAMFEACPIGEVRQIRDEFFYTLDGVVLINSGGWMPYLVPFLIGLVLKEKVQDAVKNAFSLPDNEIEKITPPAPVLTFA
jgi:hypothetical protein